MFTEGFGITDPAKLVELKKALEAGHAGPSYGGEAGGQGWQLIPQSLEGTLATATAQSKHVRFYKALPKPPDMLKATVHEFTRMTALGTDLEAFVGEGRLPTEDASQFVRDYVKVRYLATLRRVTDPMSAVNLIGGTDALGREALNGTLHLLVQLEKALFYGDEDINGYSWNGIFKEIATKFSDNVFDLKGETLTTGIGQDILATMISQPRYGAPDAFWVAPEAQINMSKAEAQQMFYMQQAQNGGMATPNSGMLIKNINGPLGPVAVESDIFLRPIVMALGVEGDAPVAPAIGSVTTPPDGGSKFYSGDDGDYWYSVRGVSDKGKTAPVNNMVGSPAVETVVSVAEGDKVTFPITSSSDSTTNPTSFFEVYRSKRNALQTDPRYLIGKIKRTGASVTFNDLNADRAGTSKGIVMEYDPSVCQFRRMMDLMRVPLAKIDLSTRFAIVLFGALIIETPSKVGTLINIG